MGGPISGGGGGFSNPMTTAGDLIVGGASGTPERLPLGAEGESPRVVGGALVYAAGVPDPTGAPDGQAVVTTGGAYGLAAPSSGPALSSATPQPIGTATAGVSTAASRADHVHASASRSPVPPACVARWLLDDTTSTITDSVGSDDLAYSGAASQQGRPSPWGRCLYTGGLAAGAGPKGAATVEPAAVTVLVWVKALAYASPSPFLVGKRQDDAAWSGSNPTNWGVGLYTDTSGRVGAGSQCASGAPNVLAASDSWRITLGVWCRVVASYSTTDGLRLYLDGQLVGTAAAAGAIQWGSGSWTIGVNNSGSGVVFPQVFDGFVRDVCVCDRVLTADEILRDYQQGIGYAP